MEKDLNHQEYSFKGVYLEGAFESYSFSFEELKYIIPKIIHKIVRDSCNENKKCELTNYREDLRMLNSEKDNNDYNYHYYLPLGLYVDKELFLLYNPYMNTLNVKKSVNVEINTLFKNRMPIKQFIEKCDPYQEIDSFVLRMENFYKLSLENNWYAFDFPFFVEKVPDFLIEFILNCNPYCLKIAYSKKAFKVALDKIDIKYTIETVNGKISKKYDLIIPLEKFKEKDLKELFKLLIQHDELNGSPFHFYENSKEFLLIFENDLSYGIWCEIAS